MKPDPDRIVSGITKVASLPVVFTKLTEALKNPATSNQDLEYILSEDTALAARVLRIANSAIYSFPSRIDSISRAITLIGHQQLQDIVLACSIVQLFKDIPQEVVDMESFWLHSISCATAARVLADLRHEHNIERFFTAGLLHDIGRLIMFMEIPKQSREILMRCEDSGDLMYRVEQEVLGFDHATIGGLLLKKWRLPDRLVSAVAYHHYPNRAQDYTVEAGVVHIADIMCHAMQYGSSGEHLVPALQTGVWEKLDISVDMVSPALDLLDTQTNEVVKHIVWDGA